MAYKSSKGEAERKKTLVIASKNKGKIVEFSDLLGGVGIRVLGLSDFEAFEEVVEDGETFQENALKKALITAGNLGLPALADDSGLTVEALGGLPGVRSARYAGEKATDSENNEKLLAALKGIEDRAAAFVCVIAMAAPDGTYRLYEGRCEGVIAKGPEGNGGFGYDPLFYYPPLGKTFAQMDREEKNAVSHRGKAIRLLLEDYNSIVKWLYPSEQLT
jgi:XTP/dITP diphosphohydrolase